MGRNERTKMFFENSLEKAICNPLETTAVFNWAKIMYFLNSESYKNWKKCYFSSCENTHRKCIEQRMMFPCFDVKRTVQFVSVNDTHSLYYVFTF
jgi:hypothetical protein